MGQKLLSRACLALISFLFVLRGTFSADPIFDNRHKLEENGISLDPNSRIVPNPLDKGFFDAILHTTSNELPIALQKISDAIAFVFFTPAYASPPSSPYTPGETLDPTCAPEATNCTVTDLPTGSNTQIIYNNGGAFGGAANFFYASTTAHTGIGTSSPWALLSVSATSTNVSPVFTISTTTSANATSTAFLIDSNGKVGIGTTSPWAQLSVAGVSASDQFIAPSLSATSTFYNHISIGTSTGSGAQFRIGGQGILTRIGTAVIAGDLTGNSRGTNALDIQSTRNTTSKVASGNESVAVGLRNTASGNYSAVFGRYNTVSGSYSVAIGSFSTVSGSYSVAIGSSVGSSFDFAVNVGYGNALRGNAPVALGSFISGEGAGAIAIGFGAQAYGEDTISIGSNSGVYATGTIAIGTSNIARGTTSAVFGSHNRSLGTSSLIFGNHITNSVSSSTMIGTADWNKLTVSANGALGLQGSTTPWGLLSLSAISTNSRPLVLFSTTTSSNSTSTAFLIDSTGKVGIGTTSPFTQLSVQGQSASDYFTAVSNTATSTFAWGIKANALNIISSSASSTFSNGINLSAGCFAVNGTCLKSGAFLSSAGLTNLTNISDLVGVGTATPYAKLSVQANANQATDLFAIASSSQKNLFSVNNRGGIVQQQGANPTLAGGLATGLTSANDVYVSGKYAYLARQLAGLSIVDISSTTDISLLDTFNTTGSAYDVKVSGKYAYVADGSSGLLIMDVSEPTSPKPVGSFNTSGSAYGVYVSGKYAYVADGSSGLEVIDVSNPAAPSLVSTLSSTNAQSVYVSGKYAYLADFSAGLKVVDISNPSQPILTGTFNTSAYAYDVYVSGEYAYVSDFTSGLKIVNISNPANPTPKGGLAVSNFTYDLYVSGRYAYIADTTSGIRVADISNPSSPVLVGTFDTTGSAYGVFVSGKYIYVADFSGGLQVGDMGGAEFTGINAGSIEAGNLAATENLVVGNDVAIGGGLNVGINGILSRGPLSIYVSTTTISTAIASTSAFFQGRVGIGTTSPAASLSIKQNSLNDLTTGLNITASDGDYRAIYMGTTQTLNFQGGAGNTATLDAAGLWTDASDIAFKENISDLSYGLDEVLKLQPRFYDVKGLPNDRQVGFIAQEVEKIIPEVVSGEEGHKGIAYGHITAILVNAIKELNSRIDSLGAGVAQFAGRIKEVITDRLTVGSPENRTGITLYDEATGEPYCVKVSNGATVTIQGTCALQTSAGSGAEGSSGTSGTDTEAPIITILGNNPVNLSLGDSYSDPGVSVTDNVNNNLGVYASVDGTDVGDISNIIIDTASSSTHVIVYRATDQADNTATAERQVIVSNPNQESSEEVPEESLENNDETATTTVPVAD